MYCEDRNRPRKYQVPVKYMNARQPVRWLENVGQIRGICVVHHPGVELARFPDRKYPGNLLPGVSSVLLHMLFTVREHLLSAAADRGWCVGLGHYRRIVQAAGAVRSKQHRVCTGCVRYSERQSPLRSNQSNPHQLPHPHYPAQPHAGDRTTSVAPVVKSSHSSLF